MATSSVGMASQPGSDQPLEVQCSTLSRVELTQDSVLLGKAMRMNAASGPPGQIRVPSKRSRSRQRGEVQRRATPTSQPKPQRNAPKRSRRIVAVSRRVSG